jgi:hypothetical protein
MPQEPWLQDTQSGPKEPWLSKPKEPWLEGTQKPESGIGTMDVVRAVTGGLAGATRPFTDLMEKTSAKAPWPIIAEQEGLPSLEQIQKHAEFVRSGPLGMAKAIGQKIIPRLVAGPVGFLTQFPHQLVAPEDQPDWQPPMAVPTRGEVLKRAGADVGHMIGDVPTLMKAAGRMEPTGSLKAVGTGLDYLAHAPEYLSGTLTPEQQERQAATRFQETPEAPIFGATMAISPFVRAARGLRKPKPKVTEGSLLEDLRVAERPKKRAEAVRRIIKQRSMKAPVKSAKESARVLEREVPMPIKSAKKSAEVIYEKKFAKQEKALKAFHKRWLPSKYEKYAKAGLGGTLAAATYVFSEGEAKDRVESLAGITALFAAGKKSFKRVGLMRKGLRVAQVFKQAKNRVKTPEAKTLMNDITIADEKWHRRAGSWHEDLRKAKTKKIGNIADKLEDVSNPKDVASVRTVLDDVHAAARKVGIEIGKVKNYFPRVMKHDIAMKVFDDVRPVLNKLEGIAKEAEAAGRGKEAFTENAIKQMLEKKSTQTQDIIKHLLKTGQAKTYSGAIRTMERIAAQELFRKSPFEQPRVLDLPSWVYERDAAKVLPRYINIMSRRIAEVEVFGKNARKANDLLLKIGEKDFAESQTARKILDLWSGEFERAKGLRGTARELSDLVVGFEVGTKIGLGTATIPNITQPLISTLGEVPTWQFVKGLSKAIVSPARRTELRRSGALSHSHIRTMVGYQPGGLAGAFAKATTLVFGFDYVNKGNLYQSGSSFMGAAKSWHKAAQKNTRSGRYARDRLSDYGIDYKKPLTRETLLEKTYRFATDDQLQRNVLKDPIAFNHPAMRPFVLFKRFGFKQATKIKDMLLREFKREGITTPEAIRRTLPVVLKLLVGSQIGGEFVIWAKNGLLGLLSGEPRYRREELFSLERFVSNLAAVGTFGVISDFAEIEKLSGLGRKARFLAEPAVISDVFKAFEAYTKVMEDYEKYGDAWLTIRRQGIPRLTEPLGTLPRHLGKQFLTKSQKSGRVKYFKGKEKAEIIDLILKGKGAEASRRIQLWNKAHPTVRDGALTYEDINSKAIRQAAQRKAKAKAIAKQ